MFEIRYKSGNARSGVLHTAHGKVKTPFFMPVATKASVKAVESEKLVEMGYQALISNSFILSLNPGVELIEGFGGIHRFMNFKNTIVTDSGGFQVLSKEFLMKKSDEGVLFKDPKTGIKNKFTPEICMSNQIILGSDIAMTLDDVPHHGLNGKDYVDSIRRTHAWAKRCLDEHKRLKSEYGSKQLLFGITQGGVRKEYRTFSTNKMNRMDFDGVALGGMVIGESRSELLDTVKLSISNLDDHKIKYLMGLGSPPDIVRAAGMGVDCFDSAYPTANARHGSLITDEGRINIRNKIHSTDASPIMEGCGCEVCKNYSKAYVHYQLKVHELVGYRLATIHNLYYMMDLMERIRKAIKEDRYSEFEKDYMEKYFSKREKKEFSNLIKEKYFPKDEKQRPIYLLDHKK